MLKTKGIFLLVLLLSISLLLGCSRDLTGYDGEEGEDGLATGIKVSLDIPAELLKAEENVDPFTVESQITVKEIELTLSRAGDEKSIASKRVEYPLEEEIIFAEIPAGDEYVIEAELLGEIATAEGELRTLYRGKKEAIEFSADSIVEVEVAVELLAAESVEVELVGESDKVGQVVLKHPFLEGQKATKAYDGENIIFETASDDLELIPARWDLKVMSEAEELGQEEILLLPTQKYKVTLDIAKEDGELVVGIVVPKAPDAPTGLARDDNGNLVWEQQEEAIGYRVYRTETAEPQNLVKLADVAENRYEADLEVGYYWVRTYVAGGYSSDLNEKALFINDSDSGENQIPQISAVKGELINGGNLTLTGAKFTEKENDKPLLYWQADFGEDPSDLSRVEWNGGKFSSHKKSQKIVASGSQQSFGFDHGRSSGAALGGVSFNSDFLFVHRKVYEDFDITTDYAIRTRVIDVDGTKLEPGMKVEGTSSGATGIINRVASPEADRPAIYYKQEDGTINEAERTDFEWNEIMVVGDLEMTNAEGSSKYPTGTYRTFNFKTIRLWNDKDQNNIWKGAGRKGTNKITPEYTDGTLWGLDEQIPNKWKVEELFYKTSGIDLQDGIFDFFVNNKMPVPYERQFRNRNEKRPNKYDVLYQSQVSNGAQQGSVIYYDTLYIDDTWHHVALAEEDLWANVTHKEIQPILAWNDNQIEVQVQLGKFYDREELYLYVIDKERNVNQHGYSINLTDHN